MATHRRLLAASLPLILLATGCSGAHHTGTTGAGWTDTNINTVSKPVIGSGVTAVTALRRDGQLETVVSDVTNGTRLWAQAATMSGRPAGMGVAPPAVTDGAHAVVAGVEPQGAGVSLTGRDPRTGRLLWMRPVGTTFGPAGCGNALCVTERTARKDAHFSVVDPANGKLRWKIPGVAEVEWSDARRVVVFRLAAHPALESRDLKTGKRLWTYPVERAVGTGVNLSGGWSFGSLGDSVIGYLAPYQAKQKGPLSSFGFFSVRLADGHLQWVRKRLLRVYPSASPAVALITRQVDKTGQYGGFAQLDPHTGDPVVRIPADVAPKTNWWLAFPPDLSTLGFLAQGANGRTYDLHTGHPVTGNAQGWSFCATAPAPLKIKGLQGFYPIAALCPYDLKSGHQLTSTTPPPGWYTGASDGWRVWRDQKGALHGIHDANGDTPGMYGQA